MEKYVFSPPETELVRFIDAESRIARLRLQYFPVLEYEKEICNNSLFLMNRMHNQYCRMRTQEEGAVGAPTVQTLPLFDCFCKTPNVHRLLNPVEEDNKDYGPIVVKTRPVIINQNKDHEFSIFLPTVDTFEDIRIAADRHTRTLLAGGISSDAPKTSVTGLVLHTTWR